jgi:hypothetical protein
VFLSGEGLFRYPRQPRADRVLLSHALAGGECRRVGSNSGNVHNGINRGSLRQSAHIRFVDRPVTDESRLVTATILLVNAFRRKHGILVSGAIRRIARRPATELWDDLPPCHESALFWDETRSPEESSEGQRRPAWAFRRPPAVPHPFP